MLYETWSVFMLTTFTEEALFTSAEDVFRPVRNDVHLNVNIANDNTHIIVVYIKFLKYKDAKVIWVLEQVCS